MPIKNRNLAEYPWHAILFAIYPPLALLAHNIGEVDVGVAYRSIFISIIIAGILTFALTIILKNWNKAGLIVLLNLVLFFYYGHVYNLVRNIEVSGLLIGRHRFLILLWILIFFLNLWAILRQSEVSPSLTSGLNLIALVLIILPVFQLGKYAYSQWQADQKFTPQSVVPAGYTPEKRPDVYFIILDMYGRSDILLNKFNYDNSSFLEELENLGFFVEKCSRSNYMATDLSLATTLNMDYLPALSDEFSPEKASISTLHKVLKNSIVTATFKELGYKTIAFETGYEWAELDNVDTFFTFRSREINSFEGLLIRNTLLLILDDFGFLDSFQLTADEWKRDSVLFTFETLRTLPDTPGPKFVVAHIMMPHPIFVFGPEGELDVIPPRYKDGEDYYLEEDFTRGVQNQVAFINNTLPDIISNIIKHSEEPPIIIIQGDHGFRFLPLEEQLKNLSAYYFPEPHPELHHHLTPVNNFRIIFRSYFGFDLPDLPNKSYIPGQSYFDFIEVDNDCLPTE